jgi:NitT/TauT family transport system substrate-binding protein
MKALACFATLVLAIAACGGPAASADVSAGPTATAGAPAESQVVEGTIRVALGDIESVETLALFIAVERVRERGIDVELIELADEDLANQAVVGGQADIGLGAPYGLIQELDAPVRIFCRLATAAFFPVVDKALYPDWQALDGETLTVHSRASGTEAIARLIEQVEGIKFGELSYVPGSEVRATALLQGTVKATILDIPNKNFVMSEEPDRFHILPIPDIDATDEALFGNTEWLQENEALAQVLLEEILTVWRSMVDDPSFVVEERERLGLLTDLPAELEAQLLPYYEQAGEEGVFSTDCGGSEAAQDDFEFFTVAGTLVGEPADLAVEDFWYLEPSQRALESLGG